jgi:hypothetical protein
MQARAPRIRLASTLAALCFACWMSAWLPSLGAAQEGPPDPWRIVALTSVGAPLRVTRRADLGQSTFAPPFVDAHVALLLPGRGELRHGPLLGVSTNLSIDGGFYAPVDALSQWVFAVGYMGRYALSDDLLALGHVALPFDVGESGSVGAELSVGLAYRVLAGFGAFAAWSGNVFGGEGGSSVITSLEIGAFIDYEVWL